MSEKEVLILSDKNTVPTDDYLFSLMGEKKILWQSIMEFAFRNYKDISGSWNYYNDGKQWLFKLVQKKKTIFWGALLMDAFRITFYFADKAEPEIESSDLPQVIKDGFRTAKKYGLIRPVSVRVTDKEDVVNVLRLIEIKHKIK
jgi:hypothetical protein